MRQSLSDVCDQMALHLLVAKSSVTDDELNKRAATIQLPLPPAYEERRRAEAEVGGHNLFTELATVPARFTLLSAKASALSAKANEEISLLGDEMRRFIQRVEHIDRALVAEKESNALLGAEVRRFIQRVEHIDRALVAETEATALLGADMQRSTRRIDHIEQSLVSAVAETGRDLADLVSAGLVLSERMTAINSALTRRIQAMTDEVRDAFTAQLRDEQARSSERSCIIWSPNAARGRIAHSGRCASCAAFASAAPICARPSADICSISGRAPKSPRGDSGCSLAPSSPRRPCGSIRSPHPVLSCAASISACRRRLHRRSPP
jgi:CII-binding regulator of phage lambda lysogenization HflD